jgi:hypothetical protein
VRDNFANCIVYTRISLPSNKMTVSNEEGWVRKEAAVAYFKGLVLLLRY